MKVAVISNCAHRSIALAVRTLLPDAEVTSANMGELNKDHAEMRRCVDAASDCDMIVIHPHARHIMRDAGNPLYGVRPLELPGVVFAGFQPDVTYVHAPDAKRGLVVSPVGDYNSVLALLAFLAGRDEEQTEALFNRFVFARLGYLSAYDDCRRQMIVHFKGYGLAIDDLFDGWKSRGPFMFSVNHPRLFVIVDLVRRLFDTKGVAHAEALDIDYYFPDPLQSQPIWPVYPDVAEAIGIDGSYVFRSFSPRDKLFTLTSFVAASFAIYRDIPRDVLEAVPAVQRAYAALPEIDYASSMRRAEPSLAFA